MKAKYSSLLVLGLLLFTSQESQAVQLSQQNSVWSEIESSSSKRPRSHSKVQLKSKHKKAAKKSKKKTHKKKHTHDSSLVDASDGDEGDSIQKKEAAIITNTVNNKLDQLNANDASLSDMYMFSKVISNGKTVAEAKKEEEAKVQALAVIEEKKKEEEDKKLDAFRQIEKEEEEKKQEAIDVTTRKMLAQQYEQMEIDDEKREGIDNGFDSYKVVSDMKAEQDYAINQYKGSGEMSEMLDEIKADAQKQRLQDKQQLASVNMAHQAIQATEVTADKGEKEIIGDSENMYAFSAFAAAQAAAQMAS